MEESGACSTMDEFTQRFVHLAPRVQCGFTCMHSTDAGRRTLYSPSPLAPNQTIILFNQASLSNSPVLLSLSLPLSFSVSFSLSLSLTLNSQIQATLTLELVSSCDSCETATESLWRLYTGSHSAHSSHPALLSSIVPPLTAGRGILETRQRSLSKQSSPFSREPS